MRGRAAGEVLLVGGRVYGDAEAEPTEALLVRGGRVAAVGPEAALRACASKGVRIVPLRGATVTPGLVDAHVHLTTWAIGRQRVSLSGARTIEEAVQRITASEAEEEWVLGQGWDRNLWDRDPTRRDLDRRIADRPVLLDSHDLHAAWLNSEALRRCGVGGDTPDPVGGRIERDAGGEATGVLYEAARSRALERVPAASPGQVRAALLAAQTEAHRLGITGIHSVEVTGLSDFEALLARDELRLRVLQHVQLHQLEAAVQAGTRSGQGGDWIRIGGVKMFLDGSLGSRTAWLREPYEGTISESGIATLPAAEFEAAVQHAAEHGLAATVHAIGDAAVELALRVLARVAPPAALPHRIEHLQLCPEDLWSRAGGSGVVASMQPVHLLTDLPIAERHWGHDRCRGAFAFGTLRRHGMVLAFGSDAPVESIDPRPGLFAATRRATWAEYAADGGGRNAWYAEHRLTAREALAAYTRGPAIAAGLDGTSGRLLPGFDADLTAWSRDPLTARPEEYRMMECVMTMVCGEIVHGSDR